PHAKLRCLQLQPDRTKPGARRSWSVPARPEASPARLVGTNLQAYAGVGTGAGRRRKTESSLKTFSGLLCGIVIQALPEPSFDFRHGHCFALAVVGDLVSIDLAKAEITRFRVGKVKTAHARSRPHCERFCDLN